jgi:hypothetical protein
MFFSYSRSRDGNESLLKTLLTRIVNSRDQDTLCSQKQCFALKAKEKEYATRRE